MGQGQQVFYLEAVSKEQTLRKNFLCIASALFAHCSLRSKRFRAV